MPIHDWTRVPSGLFHHFHQDWSIEIARRLNAGILPKRLSALVEQRIKMKEGDVLAIETRSKSLLHSEGNGTAVRTIDRPKTRFVRKSEIANYAAKANRIVVKHNLGRIVAVIEIVSPGNKHSKAAIREFLGKTLEYLESGIHVLIVDLFPPTPRDPHSLHKLIWDEFEEEPFALPKKKNRILASYEMGRFERTAYVEPVGVGGVLPDMPLFVAPDLHVMVPLETTYNVAWKASPEVMRLAVQTGVLPEADED